MRTAVATLLALFSLLCTTCVKHVTVPRPSYAAPAPACENAPSDVDVVTYNAGLGPGIVKHAAARAPHVIDAVAATPFDVLCLQEIWTDGDCDAIVGRLGLPAQNVAYARTAGLGETGADKCSPGRLDKLSACARDKCKGVDDEDLSACALANCRSALTWIFIEDRNCVNCLAAMAGHGIDDIRSRCVGTGMSRIYGGRNGVVLASRWPLKDAEARLLNASNANRVALFARVEVPGKGEIEIACTHLSATEDVAPFHSGHADWDEERAEQLDAISSRLAERAGGRPQLLVGDMNFGGADDAVEEESGWVWYRAHELGFTDPVAHVRPRLCSRCPWNTFVSDTPKGKLIDHALLRDPDGGLTVTPTCARREFESPVTVTGYDGKPVVTSLSDHYGIRAKFLLH